MQMLKPPRDLILNTLMSVSPGHKGMAGRVAIVGGSEEYTGAPYFAAISALKTGCDLVYVFCAKGAAIPIKSYSPELIVLPLLDSDDPVEKLKSWIPRLHSLVIGPGLGRSLPSNIVLDILMLVRTANVPMILDADALSYMSLGSNVIRNYSKAVLTPNAVEFDRLEQLLGAKVLDVPLEQRVCNAAQLLGVTVVRKGATDIISDGQKIYQCELEGSARRCGGQGDILAGSMGTLAHWAFAAQMPSTNPLLIAAYVACALTRRCNCLAFSELGRSTTTSDMITFISRSFKELPVLI